MGSKQPQPPSKEKPSSLPSPPLKTSIEYNSQKLADKIASQLESDIPSLLLIPSEWDQDEARAIIRMMLPVSTVELERDMYEIQEQLPKPDGPSVFLRLKDLLHADGLSIKCVLEAAIVKIERTKAVESELSRLVGSLEKIKRDGWRISRAAESALVEIKEPIS